MADKISWSNETRKLSELEPWARNPRQINKRQAERLVESFDQFGQVETIAIGPQNQIYNGHQRLNVLKEKYGEDYEVEVRVASRALTEKEREKLVIFLHKGAAGDWDFDMLANEFELDDLLEWGFDKQELDLDLWADEPPEDVEPQIDKAEELREKWGVESGQLWKLGEHRIICGDCTDKAVVERVMQGDVAGAVVTDPPYGINREGIENDDPEGLQTLFNGCLAVMPIENAVVIAFQSPRLFPVWLDAIREHNQKFERALWWREIGNAKPWRGFRMQGECILVSSVGRPAWDETRSDPDTFDNRNPRRDGHPTQKPTDVVEALTGHTTGIVYDPFVGSGTTLIACERLGRKCRAVEISPAYCAVAIQRWVDVTNGTPELVN